MVFHNSNLDFNKVKFSLKIKLENVSEEKVKEIFNHMKKDNLEIKTELHSVIISKNKELEINEVKNRDKIKIWGDEESILSTSKEMKEEYNEIMSILKLYSIEVDEVKYRENYYLEK